MSFLNTNYSATIAARLTQKGRNAISKGNFIISYFAIGDSEYNYSGTSAQSILAPFDKDTNVKYPLWYTSGSTYFGVPIESSITTTCKNVMSSDNGWTLSTVWDKAPIGITGNTTGYTSSKYSGIKSFLGYTKSSGQVYNTGTTITPEEQKTIAILHYSGSTNSLNDFFKYDDYISTSTGVTSPNIVSDKSYFSVTIPTLMYHKLSGATTGATFTMSTGETKTIVSNFNGRFTIDYKDLVDYTGNTVGKIFYNHKIVVFDDEEIVAALDSGSSRLYTLEAPTVDTIVTNNYPITELTTGKTLWVTYKFSASISTIGTTLDDLPCNKFMKVTGSTNNENVTVKFEPGGFKHLNSGYTVAQIFILHQLTNNGEQPTSTGWKVRNYTGELIDPPSGSIEDLKTGFTFTINQTKYDEAIPYTSSLSNFGSETAYPGNVQLVRASDIEEMAFNLSLPNEKFVVSQNPTYSSGNPKITEVALLNSNKETLVMGKLSEPIARIGAQVFSVKLDF
jgi:hypothetical protein